MYFDVDQLDTQSTYKLMGATVVPRPVAWVVSADENGKLNAAPFSFFNVLSGHPPVLAFGVGTRNGGPKDTARNIRGTGEFVVNLVPHRLIDAMNVTGIDFNADINELEAAGLETTPSTKVAPPRIAASPVAFECQLMQIVDVDQARVIILGKVVAIHVDDSAVINAERCYIDTPALDLIGRMHGGGWYVRTNDGFELPRISESDWNAATRLKVD